MKISLFFATVSGYLAAFGVIDRPQTPQERDYVIETLRLPGGADGVLLDAELTLPSQGARTRFLPLSLITGSGPQNKDEELVGHKPFLVLSDHLTRAGYGVLRYDDRGHGKSTGDYASATASDFAADAAAALSFLQSHHAGRLAEQTGLSRSFRRRLHRAAGALAHTGKFPGLSGRARLAAVARCHDHTGDRHCPVARRGP